MSNKKDKAADRFADVNVLTGRLFLEVGEKIEEAAEAQEARERNLTDDQINAALRAARPYMK